MPLVTVLTPVYNGEKYLEECIESVLAQSFRNWEYILVNNCSTDRSLAIAMAYAKKDARIRVVTNERFVGVIENHNNAFSQVSISSKYCKLVAADDRLAPACLERMVELAEAHPTAAIVGCYQQCGSEVLWKGLPIGQPVFPGRQVCRGALLNGLEVFGTPTSLLFRSDLVRSNQPFFPHNQPHADTSACFHYLEKHDFGFVYEVLCEHRVHADQASTKLIALGARNVACIDHLITYGPVFLDAMELKSRKKRLFEEYYRWLGGCLLKVRGKIFWKFQIARLRDLGYPIVWGKVIAAMLNEIFIELRNPWLATKKIVSMIKGKI